MIRAIQRRAPTFSRIRLLGTFEHQIPDEENPRAEAVDGIAHTQFLKHLQLREADIDAIEVSAHIAEGTAIGLVQ